jgi:hypothetical protein
LDGFDSAWFKFAWAVAHAKRLQADVATWRSDADRQRDIGIDQRYDPKRHRIDVWIAHIEPFPLDWGLRLGDIAHNFRCCLDHLAWALVDRGRTPTSTLSERRRRKIYFPIFDKRDDFNANLGNYLPGVRRADIAQVRSAQPYQGGRRHLHRHVLHVLARLSNDDKHRSIQPVATAPRAVYYDVRDATDCLVTRIRPWLISEPLKVGTQLAPIYVKKTGRQPHADVHGHISAEPALQQGVMMGEWLEVMPRFVGSGLRIFSDPPAAVPVDLSDSTTGH